MTATETERERPVADRSADAPLLDVRDLRVSLPSPGGGFVEVVRGVSFRVAPGGFHALVGESGCGKSVTAMALTRLPPADAAARVSGRVLFRGRDLLAASPRELRAARRKGGVAYVFQEAMSALNPVLRLRTQMREALPRGLSRAAADDRLAALLGEVGLPDPRAALRAHPCELSGGMAQRACIAMALAQEPALLLADEPTTALDVLVQRKVLDLLRDLCRARGTAVLLVTHNLALVSEYAETVSVLYAGQVVEDGPVPDVLAAPAHPYAEALLRAVPRIEGTRPEDLATIPGRVPPPRDWVALPCAFAPRCPRAAASCSAAPAPWSGLSPRHGVRCVRAGALAPAPAEQAGAEQEVE